MESVLTRILKAVADDNRLRILNLLQYHDLCVCELETLLDINQSNASRHLNKLTNAGLLNYYRSAKYIYYRLDRTFLEKHPFIAEILRREVRELEQCKADFEKLSFYREKGFTCDSIKTGLVCFDGLKTTAT